MGKLILMGLLSLFFKECDRLNEPTKSSQESSDRRSKARSFFDQTNKRQADFAITKKNRQAHPADLHLPLNAKKIKIVTADGTVLLWGTGLFTKGK